MLSSRSTRYSKARLTGHVIPQGPSALFIEGDDIQGPRHLDNAVAANGIRPRGWVGGARVLRADAIAEEQYHPYYAR